MRETAGDNHMAFVQKANTDPVMFLLFSARHSTRNEVILPLPHDPVLIPKTHAIQKHQGRNRWQQQQQHDH